MNAQRIFDRARADTQPPLCYPPYTSTAKRAPLEPLIPIPPTALELGSPLVPLHTCPALCDLTQAGRAPPLGERIIVSGHVTDEDGKPLVGVLIELWQANAAGRYKHLHDTHDAPIDPHFEGSGAVVTDADGAYRFITIKPGAYPWRNHPNAWRPAHLHFSVFGACLLTRLVTQMSFPGDPLLAHDPIFMSIANRAARERLVAPLDWSLTVPEFGLGYRFDIVLGGRSGTPGEQA